MTTALFGQFRTGHTTRLQPQRRWNDDDDDEDDDEADWPEEHDDEDDGDDGNEAS